MFLPANSFPVSLLSCCSSWLVKHAWKRYRSYRVQDSPAAHFRMHVHTVLLTETTIRAGELGATPCDGFPDSSVGLQFPSSTPNPAAKSYPGAVRRNGGQWWLRGRRCELLWLLTKAQQIFTSKCSQLAVRLQFISTAPKWSLQTTSPHHCQKPL